MDTKTFSDCSSFSPASSSSPPSADVAAGFSSGQSSENPADRMVSCELEAAEILADLALSAMRQNNESSRKWGNKGKRARCRVKNESPAGDSTKNTNNSIPMSSDLSQDLGLFDQQQCQKVCRSGTIRTVKAEQDAELPKPSPVCSTSYVSFGGSRSRQNLSEAEKEARRLRRVLANRESARQTIRRRQALCEELTRKAADLTQENESLKREKEIALKEYESLKSSNEHLKAQMVKAKEAAVTESRVQSMNTTSTNYPLLFYNYPQPFTWPSVLQSSNSVQSQHGSQNHQENPSNIDISKTPLYIVPCPWFFPHPDQGKEQPQQPTSSVKDKQDEISMNSQHIEIKIEASCSKEVKPPANNINKPPAGGGGKGRSRGMIPMPAPVSYVRPAFNVKQETGLEQEIEGVSSKPNYNSNVKPPPEKNQECVDNSSKKLMDATAAAEARKRRKQLTKLKNLHGRQCRIH